MKSLCSFQSEDVYIQLVSVLKKIAKIASIKVPNITLTVIMMNHD